MLNHTLSFDPQPILKEAEERIKKEFKQATAAQIEAFFSEKQRWGDKGVEKVSGAGLLLIRDFLEKKFDDPKTLEKMQKYFDDNFDRIMEECMQKALQHKANAFVFQKAKDKEIPQQNEGG